MVHSTAPEIDQNARSVSISPHLSVPGGADWRGPTCSDACTSQRVLVAEGDFRGWRDVVEHDHAAYEQLLEGLVVRLAGLAGRPSSASHRWVRAGSLTVDLFTLTASVDGRVVTPSRLEWDLLELLARSPGEVIRWEPLVATLWPDRCGDLARNRRAHHLLREVLCRLRTRLGDARGSIVTRGGLGLVLDGVVIERPGGE